MKQVSLSKFYQIVSNFNSQRALNSQVSSSYIRVIGLFLCSNIAAILGAINYISKCLSQNALLNTAMKYETGFIVKVLPNCFQFQLSESTQLPSFFILLNRSSLRVIGLFLCSNIAAILGVLSSSCLLEAQVGRSIEVGHKCAFKMFLKH